MEKTLFYAFVLYKKDLKSSKKSFLELRQEVIEEIFEKNFQHASS